jgi:hypothetical protein
MDEGFLKWLILSRQEVGIFGYLLVTMVFFLLALYKEWLVLGKPYRRERQDNEAKTADLKAIHEKMVEQRVLNERAAVLIESLKEKIKDQELEIAKLEGRRWQRSRTERP